MGGTSLLEKRVLVGWKRLVFASNDSILVPVKSGAGWKSLERIAVLAGRLVGVSKAQTKASLPWLIPCAIVQSSDLAKRAGPITC